jgi:hypothetical protein
VRIPLGVNLGTAPLHGNDEVLSDPLFGQPSPYIPKARLPGANGIISAIANIFTDKQVDQHHSHSS